MHSFALQWRRRLFLGTLCTVRSQRSLHSTSAHILAAISRWPSSRTNGLDDGFDALPCIDPSLILSRPPVPFVNTCVCRVCLARAQSGPLRLLLYVTVSDRGGLHLVRRFSSMFSPVLIGWSFTSLLLRASCNGLPSLPLLALACSFLLLLARNVLAPLRASYSRDRSLVTRARVRLMEARTLAIIACIWWLLSSLLLPPLASYLCYLVRLSSFSQRK